MARVRYIILRLGRCSFFLGIMMSKNLLCVCIIIGFESISFNQKFSFQISKPLILVCKTAHVVVSVLNQPNVFGSSVPLISEQLDLKSGQYQSTVAWFDLGPETGPVTTETTKVRSF